MPKEAWQSALAKLEAEISHLQQHQREGRNWNGARQQDLKQVSGDTSSGQALPPKRSITSLTAPPTQDQVLFT